MKGAVAYRGEDGESKCVKERSERASGEGECTYPSGALASGPYSGDVEAIETWSLHAVVHCLVCPLATSYLSSSRDAIKTMLLFNKLASQLACQWASQTDR